MPWSCFGRRRKKSVNKRVSNKARSEVKTESRFRKKMDGNNTYEKTLERYEACMVLSGVGDALGFKRGEWEFCHSGEQIHKELEQLGGLENIIVLKRNWPVSDDTVMHIATAEALAEDKQTDEELFTSLAKAYKKSMKYMLGRFPGATCMNSCHKLKPSSPGGYRISFDPRGGGCGAAMRAMCIGLRYPNEEDIDHLIKVSVESGRMTHNHPTGYLGSFAAALFTAYSIRKKPIKEWGKGMMDLLPRVQDYIKSVNVDVNENLEAWDYFEARWKAYVVQRGILDGVSEPKFPETFGIKERDVFYKTLSFNGWGGASGHDAPMIAYDALLGYDGTWKDLCSRSMFHGGDSDSTGVIAAACYGAMHGFEGVPENNHKHLEKRKELVRLARKLYAIKHRVNNAEPKLDDGKVDKMRKDITARPSDDSLDSGNVDRENPQQTNINKTNDQDNEEDEQVKGIEDNKNSHSGVSENTTSKKIKYTGDVNVKDNKDAVRMKSESEDNLAAATDYTAAGEDIVKPGTADE